MRIPETYIQKNFGYSEHVPYYPFGFYKTKKEVKKETEEMIKGLNEVMQGILDNLNTFYPSPVNEYEIKCISELGNIRFRFFKNDNGKRKQKTYSCKKKSWKEINQELSNFTDWDYFKILDLGWCWCFREIENPIEVIEKIYEDHDITQKIDIISKLDREMGETGLLVSEIVLETDTSKRNKAIIEGGTSSTLFYERTEREVENCNSEASMEIGYKDGIWVKRISLNEKTAYLEISELGGRHLSFRLRKDRRIEITNHTYIRDDPFSLPRRMVITYDKLHQLFPDYTFLWDGGWLDVEKTKENAKELEEIPITRKELVEELKKKFKFIENYKKNKL